MMQDLQDLHLAPSGVERALSWWTRFGGRRAAILTLAVTMPLIRYEYVPHALSSAVETLAEAYGMHLTVGEWDTSFSDIKITGKDVEITTGGPYRDKRVFRAHSVEFDWSLLRAFSNGATRVSQCWTEALLRRECPVPEEVFHHVTIDGATFHMERSLAGAWNTEEAVQVESLEKLTRDVRRWRIPAIEGNDVSVSWVEHIPGESGGGLVEHRTSSLDFSKVTITLANLQVPVDERENPMRFTFDGQTADGQVSVAGAMNVSRWNGDEWAPSYDLTFRLVNLGAATFGRFAAPDATVIAKSGQVDGTIRLARRGGVLQTCQIDVRLRDVTYGANPRSPFSQAGGAPLEEQLRPLKINDIISRDCRVIGDEHHVARVSQTMQTLVTASALDAAPPIVRGAASYDHMTVVEGKAPTPAEVTMQVSEQLGLRLAGEKGAAVARALTAGSGESPGSNPVARGVKSVGRGIKRLFGGGAKKPTPAPTKQPPPR
ncbi:MAG: hypothetical protein KA371_16970 [Acidobacteria bacterium]|nr:hypothetical protein [Acidobacteriota bacterium]